jgi:CDP-6-deoxy-D-xylo-4-hexulose-3-dehydrase
MRVLYNEIAQFYRRMIKQYPRKGKKMTGLKKITENDKNQLREQILKLVAEYTQADVSKTEFIHGHSAVPVSGRVYDSSDVVALVDCALDFWLTTGRFNSQFERDLAKYISARYLLTCNSGSSANLLATSALTSHMLGEQRLKPGDEVITCATGFPTTVNPLLQNNLVPVFVDVDIPTYNINADLIEMAISDKTRAIMVAHTLGNPFNLSVVMSIAKKYNLFVVEDCCDALGARYGGQMVGTFGDIGTLSFYPAHHITMGEGGAVFTNNSTLKRVVESLRDWGRDCWCEPGKDDTCKKRFQWKLGELPEGYDHKYTYSHLGYNLKITDMQAAVGTAQLGHLPEFINRRNRNFSLLEHGLSPFEDVLILPKATHNSEPSWFGFPITVKTNDMFTRDDLIQYLNNKKIGTRLLFGGNLTRQPYMNHYQYRVFDKLDNSDFVMRNTFWIGVYPGLDDAAINYVIEMIKNFITR